MDEQMQQQIVALVQAAMQGNQLAQQQIQQIAQAAQQGDQLAAQIAQMIQQVALQMLGQQAQMAKFGAKLNYLKFLKGECPEGYEMQMFKQGGTVCKKCMKKAQEGTQMPKPTSPVEEFKCGRKMKKKENGGSVEMDKCGSKMKKKACGGTVKKDKEGGSVKTETRTSKEADGEVGSYKVTRKLTVNPATKDSTMTISGRPNQAPETINNRTTGKKYWNSEVREWKNSKKK